MSESHEVEIHMKLTFHEMDGTAFETALLANTLVEDVLQEGLAAEISTFAVVDYNRLEEAAVVEDLPDQDIEDLSDREEIPKDISSTLSYVLKEDAIEKWWTMAIPQWGNVRPCDMWRKDPAKVKKFAESYLDTSFS